MKSITSLFRPRQKSSPSQTHEADQPPGADGSTESQETKLVPPRAESESIFTIVRTKMIDLLHHPGVVSDLLAVAERRTGLNRVSLVGVNLALMCLFVCFSLGGGLVCGVVGFMYPAYESVKALHFMDKEKEKRWLTYWVVFSFFHVLEFFSDHLVWWMPFYWLVKTIFLVWCMAPISKNGSMVIYTFIIKPLYSRHHENIDNVMDNAVREAGELLEMAAEKARRISEQSEGNETKMARL